MMRMMMRRPEDEDADDDEDIHRVVTDHLHLRLASNLGHIGTHLK